MSEHVVRLTVNGRQYQGPAPARMTLVDFLRDVLGLTGTHIGCEHGGCGACSVMFDGAAVRGCLMFAVQADGHQVTTVEGLGAADGGLSILQDSFWETHALQCGYCTPGIIVAVASLLKANPGPSEADIAAALADHLCRCGSHNRVLGAARNAIAGDHISGSETDAA